MFLHLYVLCLLFSRPMSPPTCSTSWNISSNLTAEHAKEEMLKDVIGYISARCPNNKFTLTDKDITEINAFRKKIPTAKHQLCYWHGIRYIEDRLAENKPPASYDPRKAHRVFDFIDPTWAPTSKESDAQ